MLGTTLPTPLYPIYQRQFGFSELLITVIFATYAASVIGGLFLFGRLSDDVGRRPLLFPGLALSALSAVAFLLAGGVLPMLAGRVLSGLSAAIFTGTATAAMVDLAPPKDRLRATTLAVAANLGRTRRRPAALRRARPVRAAAPPAPLPRRPRPPARGRRRRARRAGNRQTPDRALAASAIDRPAPGPPGLRPGGHRRVLQLRRIRG